MKRIINRINEINQRVSPLIIFQYIFFCVCLVFLVYQAFVIKYNDDNFLENKVYIILVTGVFYLFFEKTQKRDKSEIDYVIEKKLETIKSITDVLELKKTGIKSSTKGFNEISKLDNLEDEYFVLNSFIPNFRDKIKRIKLKIREGKVRRINIFLLDLKNSKGKELLRNRANTFQLQGDEFESELEINIKALLNLAEELTIEKTLNLKEFNVFLYNIFPSFLAIKFNPKEVIISNYFYDRQALNTPNLVVDLRTDNIWKEEFEGHIDFLKKHQETTKFNLLNDSDIEKLKLKVSY